MIKKFKNKKGVSIIEILVVTAIITIAFTSLIQLAIFSLKVAWSNKEQTEAINLAQEAVEASRSIRDSDWTKITPGSHGLTNTAGYWDFQGTENIINGFTRVIKIENVSRDPVTDNIDNSANDDPNTKKIISAVSWKNKKIEIVTYFTNWK